MKTFEKEKKTVLTLINKIKSDNIQSNDDHKYQTKKDVAIKLINDNLLTNISVINNKKSNNKNIKENVIKLII